MLWGRRIVGAPRKALADCGAAHGRAQCHERVASGGVAAHRSGVREGVYGPERGCSEALPAARLVPVGAGGDGGDEPSGALFARRGRAGQRAICDWRLAVAALWAASAKTRVHVRLLLGPRAWLFRSGQRGRAMLSSCAGPLAAAVERFERRGGGRVRSADLLHRPALSLQVGGAFRCDHLFILAGLLVAGPGGAPAVPGIPAPAGGAGGVLLRRGEAGRLGPAGPLAPRFGDSAGCCRAVLGGLVAATRRSGLAHRTFPGAGALAIAAELAARLGEGSGALRLGSGARRRGLSARAQRDSRR